LKKGYFLNKGIDTELFPIKFKSILFSLRRLLPEKWNDKNGTSLELHSKNTHPEVVLNQIIINLFL
jgi:hypothetical protein